MNINTPHSIRASPGHYPKPKFEAKIDLKILKKLAFSRLSLV